MDDNGHLVLGGGGVTADPGINVIPFPSSSLHSSPYRSGSTVFSCPLPPSLVRLHRAGFTLRGNFTPDNFAVYLATLDVRMAGNLHLSRYSYSPEAGVQDHRAFASSVRQVLTQRETVRPHIADWLELIDEGGVGDEYLIRYNISLMEPRIALGTLMSMRSRLEELRRSDPRAYNDIMLLLTPYEDWHVTRCMNTLMHYTRRHTERRLRRRGHRGAAFHPTARGILTVIRNCSQHAARRYEHLMVFIMEDDFRKFAVHFQRVMFNTSQLHLLNLETSMG